MLQFFKGLTVGVVVTATIMGTGFAQSVARQIEVYFLPLKYTLSTVLNKSRRILDLSMRDAHMCHFAS